MKLFAVITSERLSRPAQKGADRELLINLTEGNRTIARIIQRPGEIHFIVAQANGPQKITLNQTDVKNIINMA